MVPPVHSLDRAVNLVGASPSERTGGSGHVWWFLGGRSRPVDSPGMGEPVTVIEKASTSPGVVRFETNRTLSGTGHDIYRSLDDTTRPVPSATFARLLFERGDVELVHINGNVITVHLAQGGTSAGIRQLIEDAYIFYKEGVEVAPPA